MWSVLCANTSENPETHNVSIHEVIEEVQVRGTGAADEPIQLATGWALLTTWMRSDRGTPERLMQRIILRDPGGRLSQPMETEIVLDPFIRIRSIAQLMGFTITRGGMYEFLISHRSLPDGEWVQDAALPLEITVERVAPSP